MKDELAGRVLAAFVEWPSEEGQARDLDDLRQLAAYKYDDYEGFFAGGRFFESLARWIRQFDSGADRLRLVRFLLDEMAFISRSEMDHLIASVYNDVLKPIFVNRTAAATGVPDFRVRQISESPEFAERRRKTLFLGLSDGARLDLLRRSSPLSHEQFHLSTELGGEARRDRTAKLQKALEKQELNGPALFQHIVLVDDFYGSGTSLINHDPENDPGWKGKLRKFHDHLQELQQASADHPQVVDETVTVDVLVYVASEKARQHIFDTMTKYVPDWNLRIVQLLPSSVVVDDPDIVRMCEWFFDDVLIDEHKGRTPLGYREVALPLVFQHNTPNNSISILWADSVGRGGNDRRALFPRYERHHVDRP